MDNIHEIRIEEVYNKEESTHFYRVYYEINEEIKILGESTIEPKLVRYVSKVY